MKKFKVKKNHSQGIRSFVLNKSYGIEICMLENIIFYCIHKLADYTNKSVRFSMAHFEILPILRRFFEKNIIIKTSPLICYLITINFEKNIF